MKPFVGKITLLLKYAFSVSAYSLAAAGLVRFFMFSICVVCLFSDCTTYSKEEEKALLPLDNIFCLVFLRIKFVTVEN